MAPRTSGTRHSSKSARTTKFLTLQKEKYFQVVDKHESTFLQPLSSDLSGQSFLKSHLKVMIFTLGNLIVTFENILDKEYLLRRSIQSPFVQEN